MCDACTALAAGSISTGPQANLRAIGTPERKDGGWLIPYRCVDCRQNWHFILGVAGLDDGYIEGTRQRIYDHRVPRAPSDD